MVDPVGNKPAMAKTPAHESGEPALEEVGEEA
jgi:hypothetical protein